MKKDKLLISLWFMILGLQTLVSRSKRNIYSLIRLKIQGCKLISFWQEVMIKEHERLQGDFGKG